MPLESGALEILEEHKYLMREKDFNKLEKTKNKNNCIGKKNKV